MKTIEEHNKERSEMYIKSINERTGIQCPHCGDEMKYENSSVLLLSNPPQKKVYCSTCNYQTTIIA